MDVFFFFTPANRVLFVTDFLFHFSLECQLTDHPLTWTSLASKSLPQTDDTMTTISSFFLTMKPTYSHFYFIFIYLFNFCSNRWPMCVIMASVGCICAYATCMTNLRLSAALVATRVKRSHRRPQFIYLQSPLVEFGFIFPLDAMSFSPIIRNYSHGRNQVSSGGSSIQSISII